VPDVEVAESGMKISDQLAEQSVVSGILIGGAEALWEVLDILAPGDFYWPKHEVIVRAAVGLANRNEPVDAITLSDELERLGEASKAGGTPYLFELMSVIPTAANVGFYAQIVQTRAIRRRLKTVGIQVTQMGSAMEGDVFDLVDRARAAVDTVADTAKVDVHPVGDTIDALIDSLNRKPEYVATPWPALDELIGGFSPGGLYIVGARPGEGKTIVGLQSAAQLAHGGVVAFCSLEMSEADLQMRLLSQYGEIHMQSLRNHTLNSEQMRRLIVAKQRFVEAPIFIDDHGTTMTQIRSFVRSVSRRGKLAAVVVDYLQLIEGGGSPTQSRQEAVAEMSRQLKKMARSLNVPVIALSQLNRGNEARTDRTPQLKDLRESGAIEQDADVVLLLNYDKRKRDELQVVVAKNRHGEIGSIKLEWQGQFARLRDKSWSPFGATTLID
jgi:replicative DNA helicase